MVLVVYKTYTIYGSLFFYLDPGDCLWHLECIGFFSSNTIENYISKDHDNVKDLSEGQTHCI